MDQGVDIHVIKQMMGHRAIKTTSRYLHTSSKKIATVVSPLDIPGSKRRSHDDK